MVRTWEDADGVNISVRDTGCGMPDDVRRCAFDPFFTTKEVGRGSGQGLAISYDVVVNKHQGRIDIDSTVGEGTSITVWLPTQPAQLADADELECGIGI